MLLPPFVRGTGGPTLRFGTTFLFLLSLRGGVSWKWGAICFETPHACRPCCRSPNSTDTTVTWAERRQQEGSVWGCQQRRPAAGWGKAAFKEARILGMPCGRWQRNSCWHRLDYKYVYSKEFRHQLVAQVCHSEVSWRDDTPQTCMPTSNRRR